MIRENAIWQVLINDLARQAIEVGAMTLRSTGTQERNFIPFADVCSALIHAIELPSASVGDGLYNLGSEVSLRIIDAAERVRLRAQHFLGTTIPLHVPTGAIDDQYPSLHYDSSKLRATGLQLTNDLDTEIDALLRYCEDTFGGAS
jgi:UDP-glucose 4-epimerase